MNKVPTLEDEKVPKFDDETSTYIREWLRVPTLEDYNFTYIGILK